MEEIALKVMYYQCTPKITFLLSELTILTCVKNEKSSENVKKNLKYYYDCICFWWEILAKNKKNRTKIFRFLLKVFMQFKWVPFNTCFWYKLSTVEHGYQNVNMV